jgi:hypothetical protein
MAADVTGPAGNQEAASQSALLVESGVTPMFTEGFPLALFR